MSKLMVVQKVGQSSLDSQVVTYAKLGWALLGSPYILFNNPAQAMIFTNKKAVNPGYMTLHKDGVSSIENQFIQAHASGYFPYGDGYAWAGNASQAVVKGDIEIFNVWGFNSSGNDSGAGGILITPKAKAIINQQLLHSTSGLYYDNTTGLIDTTQNPLTLLEFTRAFISPLLENNESFVLKYITPDFEAPSKISSLGVNPYTWQGEYSENENGDGSYEMHTYSYEVFLDKELTTPVMSVENSEYNFDIPSNNTFYVRITNNTGEKAKLVPGDVNPPRTVINAVITTSFSPDILIN